MKEKVLEDELPEREYNYIYDKLVKDDLDFTGMVAYALYKKEKKEYFEKIKIKKERVTNDDVTNFHIASEIRLNGYAQEAVSFVNEFVNDVIENHTRVSIDRITGIVESKAGPKGFVNWARVITQNIIAAIIYTFLISAIFFFVWFKKSGEEEKTKQYIEQKVNPILKIPDDSIVYKDFMK